MDHAAWIAAAVDRHAERVIQASDRIWDYAEIAYTEKKSAGELMAALTEAGFAVTCPAANIPTAFTASYGSGKPVIGLLAEYDALAGLSQKAGSLRPEPLVEGACGHGCGHNLLGAGCLGAALAMKDWLDETKTPGTVVFFGCPAEEGGSGKTFMARDGVFRDVDIALSWHPGDWTGVVPTSTQANMQLRYSFTGRSAHAAASPHLGRSALDAVELMDVGVNYLREHVPQDVRMHYAVTDTGGTSPNVVQAHASVVYLLRASKIKTVRDIRERVDNIARGAALMTGTSVDIHFIKACSHLEGNVTVGREIIRCMNELGAPDFTDEERKIASDYFATLEKPGLSASLQTLIRPILASRPELADLPKAALNDVVLPYTPVPVCTPGSTDVSDVSLNCPTVMFYACTCAQGTAAHSWQMTAQGKSALAHKGMLYSAKAMALAAAHFCSDPELLEKAKAEFAAVGSHPYECPIPADVKAPIPE